MKFEQDEVTFTGGVRHGRTQGGPVAIMVGNTEWPKWEKVMSADPVDQDELDALARNAAADPARAPATPTSPACRSTTSRRPARSSSAPRPARPRPASRWAGSPRNFLEQACGARVVSHVVELGGVRAPDGSWPADAEAATVARLDDDPVRCLDPGTSQAMVERIDAAHKDGDTLGGVVEVVVHGLPPGLGLARALGPPPRLAARRAP